jgi:hypothetical protein
MNEETGKPEHGPPISAPRRTPIGPRQPFVGLPRPARERPRPRGNVLDPTELLQGPPIEMPTGTTKSSQDQLAILRVDIAGSWSLDGLIQLLTQLEQAYLAAAALESLSEPSLLGNSTLLGRPHERTADELLQAVRAFRLAGGLRVRSLHYTSPGFIEVIGALNPLKTVKDGITENRNINRKRDEARLLDERERQKQSMEHEQSMEEEHRRREEMQHTHEIEIAKLQLEAETARVQTFLHVIDRLPSSERTVATTSLFHLLLQNAESIANETRVTGVRMLEAGESSG